MRPLHLQGINDGLGEIHGGGVAPHVRRAHLQGDGRLGTRRGPAEWGPPGPHLGCGTLGFGSLEPSVPPKWSRCFGAGGLLCPTPAPQGLVCAVAALPQPPKAVRGPQARQGSVGPFISKAGIQSTTRWHSPRAPGWHQACPMGHRDCGVRAQELPSSQGLGGTGCSSPRCPKSGVLQGHLMPGLSLHGDPVPAAAEGVGMSPCLLLKAGWDGSHGNGGTGIPTTTLVPQEWGSHIHKEPRGMEVPQLWSQENPTSHTGPTVTGIPWGSQSQCLKIMFSQIPFVQQSQ